MQALIVAIAAQNRRQCDDGRSVWTARQSAQRQRFTATGSIRSSKYRITNP